MKKSFDNTRNPLYLEEAYRGIASGDDGYGIETPWSRQAITVKNTQKGKIRETNRLIMTMTPFPHCHWGGGAIPSLGGCGSNHTCYNLADFPPITYL